VMLEKAFGETRLAADTGLDAAAWHWPAR
jgi:hypothetical protein